MLEVGSLGVLVQSAEGLFAFSRTFPHLPQFSVLGCTFRACTGGGGGVAAVVVAVAAGVVMVVVVVLVLRLELALVLVLLVIAMVKKFGITGGGC